MKRGRQGFGPTYATWLVGDRVMAWGHLGSVIRVEPDPAWIFAYTIRGDDGKDRDTPTEAIQPIEGFLYVPSDQKVVDGVKYQRIQSHHTLRSYFSHSGPGWDQKGILADKEWAMKNYGRTFTPDEAFNPSKLPEIPVFTWEEVL